MTTRLLEPKDQPALEQFLRQHTPQAMVLRSNLAHSGIVDGGAPYQGRYAAAFQDGRIVGVAAHYWNGMLVLLAPEQAGAVARAATAGRKVAGILGPWQQALDVQEALALDPRWCRLRSHERLMTLPLDRLRIPIPMREGQNLHCRLATLAELDVLSEWRQQFRCEALGATPSHDLTQRSRAEVAQWIEERKQFVLLDGNHLVSGCCFNAQLPDAVQIGNVWTPPQFRSRGYGRAVVAGALEHARGAGAELGVLYTPIDNKAARTAYLAIGFTEIGDYAIVLFDS